MICPAYLPKGLFFALALVYPLLLSAQSTSEFPADNEVTTLMQQANLAMKQYQAAMQEEAAKIGKDADSKEREKNASENWQFLTSVVKTKPDNFNSGLARIIHDFAG